MECCTPGQTRLLVRDAGPPVSIQDQNLTSAVGPGVIFHQLLPYFPEIQSSVTDALVNGPVTHDSFGDLRTTYAPFCQRTKKLWGMKLGSAGAETSYTSSSIPGVDSRNSLKPMLS